MSKINEALEPYRQRNDVGEGYNRVSDYTNAFTKEYGHALRLVVYSKAIRRVGSYLGLSVGEREILALSIVRTWAWQNKRVDGGALSIIVDWSGYQKGWKSKIHWGIRSCLELGLLENKEVQGGLRVCITQKGEAALKALQIMSEKVLQEIEDKMETL